MRKIKCEAYMHERLMSHSCIFIFFSKVDGFVHHLSQPIRRCISVTIINAPFDNVTIKLTLTMYISICMVYSVVYILRAFTIMYTKINYNSFFFRHVIIFNFIYNTYNKAANYIFSPISATIYFPIFIFFFNL